jgi:hypothetical protein
MIFEVGIPKVEKADLHSAFIEVLMVLPKLNFSATRRMKRHGVGVEQYFHMNSVNLPGSLDLSTFFVQRNARTPIVKAENDALLQHFKPGRQCIQSASRFSRLLPTADSTQSA